MPLSLVIRNGTVYDGSGSPGVAADVAIDGDRIVGIGEVPDHVDAEVLDATGLAVTPGFINVLSHAWGSLQVDGTGASDLLQGVTTEVFGEAFSLGPSGPSVAELIESFFGSTDYRVDFPHLADGLGYLVTSGVSPNVASFIGGHNLRLLGAAFDNRPLTPTELDTLRGIVDEEMADGALGIGTALIYPPGNFATTDELVALCEVVAKHDGLYISHMRSEGDQFLECLDELIGIGATAGCRAEVYHLKAAGRENHHKMALAIERIEQARAAGQAVSADMYPYEAGGTALAASIPPKYHAGGPEGLQARLDDPSTRAQIAADIRKHSDDYENLYLASGGGSGIQLIEDLPDGTPARGRRLDAVAADLGMDEVDALLELVATRAVSGVLYFIVAEENIELGLSQPWVSVGSDAQAHQAIAPFTDEATHPRTYGTFARVLGKYCRERGLFTFAEAVRRMTSLPADTLRLVDRGRLRESAFADLAVLDPATVGDRATFADSHQYAVGMRHVVVNGQVAVRDGALTDARPGRHLRRGV